MLFNLQVLVILHARIVLCGILLLFCKLSAQSENVRLALYQCCMQHMSQSLHSCAGLPLAALDRKQASQATISNTPIATTTHFSKVNEELKVCMEAALSLCQYSSIRGKVTPTVHTARCA